MYYTGTSSSPAAFFNSLKTHAQSVGWIIKYDTINNTGQADSQRQLIFKKGTTVAAITTNSSDGMSYRVDTATSYTDDTLIESNAGFVGYNAPIFFLTDRADFTWHLCINDRRILAAINLGGNWQSFYIGLFTPYRTTTDHPLPLYLGGCHHVDSITGEYVNATSAGSIVDNNYNHLLNTSNTWEQVQQNAGAEFNATYQPSIDRQADLLNVDANPARLVFDVLLIGAGHLLLGQLDGVYYCSHSPTNAIITIGTEQYLTVGTADRSGIGQVFSIKLA